MTRSLITGGFGFIGRYLARQLLGEGHEVVLFDLVTNEEYLRQSGPQASAIRGTVADWAQVMDTVKRAQPDYLFHCGAALPPFSEESPQTAFQSNVVGTYNVLEAARLFETPMVIYASTVTSFGPDAPRGAPDQFAQHPQSMYGTSKVCAERIGEYYHRRYGLDFRALRLTPIFGPGRAASAGWTAYTSVAVEEAARGRPYSIKASPETLTDILYVKDAARAMIDLSAGDARKLSRRCYNLHGHLVTAQQLVDGIKRVVPDAQLMFEPDPVIVDGIKSMPSQLDASRAREDWGFRPRHSLDEAIEDFVAIVRTRAE